MKIDEGDYIDDGYKSKQYSDEDGQHIV